MPVQSLAMFKRFCLDRVRVASIGNESTTKFSQFNTLRPRQHGPHFADEIFKCVLVNENMWISIKISLKFVPKDPINSIPALVQIMVWRRPGYKPLFEATMVRLPTHICVTRPQWVKSYSKVEKYTQEIQILRFVMIKLLSVELYSGCSLGHRY